VPVLIEALNDSSYGVRYQAVKALGHIRSPEAIPALISALSNADEQLGSQIFRSLIEIGSVAVPALIELGNSSRAWMRWDRVRALGEIGDDRAITPLALALNDPDHGVAWMAARELVHFGRLCVEPVLRVLMLQNTSPWLVETASYTLREISKEYPRLQPYLQPVLQNMHGVAYNIATPLAARKALERLESSGILRTPLL
jgi:HEAT repeat protein